MNDKSDLRSQYMKMNIQAPAPGEKKDYEAVEMKNKNTA